jgi:hypothetical protein
MGSNHSNTCVYWAKDKVQVVCGCFSGTIEEFKNAVNKKYGEKHEYHDFINTALMIMKSEGANHEPC